MFMIKTKGKRGKKSIWSCDVCNKDFEVDNSRANESVKKNSVKFCSRKCLKYYQKTLGIKRLEKWAENNIHPNFNKGCGLTTDGYVWIYVNNKERNQIKVHRYLMEIKLGRKLLATEIVHHNDFNKLNNSIENLKIMTKSEHNKIHRNFCPENRDDTWSKYELDLLKSDLKNKEICKRLKGRTIAAIATRKNRLKRGQNVKKEEKESKKKPSSYNSE